MKTIVRSASGQKQRTANEQGQRVHRAVSVAPTATRVKRRLMNLSGTILALATLTSACTYGSTSSEEQATSEPTRESVSVVDVTMSGNGASSQSYYLDGSYAVTITVYHSSEQCRLAVYARGPEESIRSAIYQGVVVGNTGTFPDYSQTFDWDSEYFSEETVRIVSESACEKVRLQLRRE